MRIKLALAFCIALLCAPQPIWAAQRAFVIGISKYQTIERLDNPEVDAKAVAKKLSDASYDVTLVLSEKGDRQTLLNEWDEFLKKVAKGDNIVVFYSGHGVDIKGANYLVPRDAPSFANVISDVTMKSNLVPFRDLMSSMEDREVEMQVWIIDACRSNPFVKGGKPILKSGGLTGDVAASNRFILYSANYGQIALDRLQSDPPKQTLGSPFSRLFVSLFDTWKGRSIRDFSGELRAKTMALVDPWPQFPVWEDGVLPLWCFVQCEPTDVQKALAQNQEAAKKLAVLANLVAREKYPLEPNEFRYTLEISMDHPLVQSYTSRVQKDIVKHLRDAREGRGETRDDLKNENVLFMISNRAEWKPRRDEGRASRLLDDGTTFYFSAANTKRIQFSCMSASTANLIVRMPPKAEANLTVSLVADFQKRVFRKWVWCQNPPRSGSDNISFSSVDLIGKALTWHVADGAQDDAIAGEMKSLFLKFSYDYGFGQSSSIPETAPAGRAIPVEGTRSVEILPSFVGLDGLNFIPRPD